MTRHSHSTPEDGECCELQRVQEYDDSRTEDSRLSLGVIIRMYLSTFSVHLVGGSALALVSKMSRSNLSSLSNTSSPKERKDVCSLLSCCSGVQTSSRTGIRGN